MTEEVDFEDGCEGTPRPCGWNARPRTSHDFSTPLISPALTVANAILENATGFLEINPDIF